MERKWGSPREPIQRTYGVETGCTGCCCTVDVRTRARTYGHCLAGKPYFRQKSDSLWSPWFRAVIVGIGLIEGFSQIWRTRTIWSFQRHVSTQVSFNSHNAHCYFPCTVRLFCVPRTHGYFTTLTACTYSTWTLSFWEKRCAESVNQVRLVKRHACKIQTR
jgi:hypothetical protein